MKPPRRFAFVLTVTAWLTPLLAGEIDLALLADMKARSIGPAGMSGRVTAIEAVAANPRIVYAGAATGGVWKSVDGGLTFKPIFDGQPVHAIGALAVNQTWPDIVWAGSGEGNVRNSVSIGGGVFKSLDAGKTWSFLGLKETERIHRIVLHPGDPNIAYAAALGQLWGENPERGVFKTVDGGKTWSKILFVDEKTGCGELVMDPSNPNKLIAAMWQFRRWPHFFKSGGPGSGLYITHDGGETWKQLTAKDGLPAGELGKIGLAFAPSQPDTVYALAEAKKSALLRSDDGGLSWRSVNTAPTIAGRPFYYGDLRVDPQFPNRVYRLESLVQVSDDGGKTFRPLRGAAFPFIHPDNHAMWIDPANGEHIFLGNDGGIAESRDRGQNFRFVSNLPLAQFYHIAVDMERPYNIYGGLQDNGSWRGPNRTWTRTGVNNSEWRLVSLGDGFDTLPDPKNANFGYSMFQGGGLMRWNLHNGEAKIIQPPPREDDTRLRFNWNAGIAIDPHDKQTIYYGSQFLHKSSDYGRSWQTLSDDLTTNNPEWQKQDESGGLTPDVTGAENYTSIIAIAPSPVAAGQIWIGTDDGRLHLTRDGGGTWASLEDRLPGAPANPWIPHIAASPHDAASAFLVLDCHRNGLMEPFVYRTDDYGQTWTNLTTDDIEGYALCVVQDPVAPDLLFLGTEFGLWLSFDGGKAWRRWKHGLPTLSVMDMVIHPREHDLVIGSHGRGVYIIDDIRPLRTLSAEILAKPLHLFEIADAQQHFMQMFPVGTLTPGAGFYRGQNPPYGALIHFTVNHPDLPNPAKKEAAADEADAEAQPKAKKRKKRKAKKPEPEPKPAADKQAETPAPKKTPTKAKIRVVRDGKTVREFEAPVKLGLNRAVWDLRRDGFKSPPGNTDNPFADPRGPEVPPGVYQVTVTFDEVQAEASVRVAPDPHAENSDAEWQARWAFIERAGAANDTAVDAIARIQDLKRDIDDIGARVRRDARRDGEKDPAKIEEHPVLKAGAELSKKLGPLEKRLWTPPDAKGIPADRSVMSDVGVASFIIQTAWRAPSPADNQFLAKGERALAAFLADFNAFFAEDVKTYRETVRQAEVRLLPEAPPLAPPAQE